MSSESEGSRGAEPRGGRRRRRRHEPAAVPGHETSDGRERADAPADTEEPPPAAGHAEAPDVEWVVAKALESGFLGPGAPSSRPMPPRAETTRVRHRVAETDAGVEAHEAAGPAEVAEEPDAAALDTPDTEEGGPEALKEALRAAADAEARARAAEDEAARQTGLARVATEERDAARREADEQTRSAREAETARAAAEQSERRQREHAIEAESAAAEAALGAEESRQSSEASAADLTRLRRRLAEAEEQVARLSSPAADVSSRRPLVPRGLLRTSARRDTGLETDLTDPATRAAVVESARDVMRRTLERVRAEAQAPAVSQPAVETPEPVELVETPEPVEPRISLRDASPSSGQATGSISFPTREPPSQPDDRDGRFRTYQRVRRGVSGVVGAVVAVGCGVAVLVLVVTGDTSSRAGLTVGLGAVALLGALFAYRRIGSASEVRLDDSGTLRLVLAGGDFTFDLTSESTEVEMVGAPDDREWRILVLRRSRDPVILDAGCVDPYEFTEVVRQWRPDL